MTSPELTSASDLFRTNENSVLFVTSQLRPRELKMADGMRRLGWIVGLIYYKWTPFNPREYFDFCIEVGSFDEAHSVARKLSPRVTHVFSGAIDDLVLKFCRQKPSPVVIDLNDVFAPSLFDYCHERFEPTREALALAEGFCARDLQVKSAERADKFRLPPRLLFFPEYCWNTTSAQQATDERARSNEVHVVSVGTISLESQGMYDSCYLRLANLLVKQGIHFHIYPHWAYRRDHLGSPQNNFEKDFADFLALEKTTPYLHVHDSLPTEELAKVLPQYDFGIVSGGCAQFGQKLEFYHPAYLETCYSGRISDYLDARLPVLINDEVKFDYWLLKRYGACVDLKGVLRPGFKQTLLHLKRDARQREIMESAAQELSVSHNSPRLAAFYREIIAAGILDRTYNRTLEPGWDKRPAPTAIRRVAEMGALNQLTSLRKIYRWFAPRAAKIILPYRAIRLLEVRLHNALQENQSAQATIAALHAQVTSLQQYCASLDAQVGKLRGEAEASAQQLHVLSNEKFILQQEAQWGKLSINEIAGVLNWPEVLNDAERANGFSELVRILGLFSGVSSTIDSPSACWDILAIKNYDQLLTFGYNNFKRTIANNYFNFLVQQGDPQIQAVEALLAPEVVESCRLAARSIPEAPAFPCADQFSYNYFVLLLWEYVKTIDHKHYAKTLKEPEEGNPIVVSSGGQNVSQDLANSLIEYYAISETVSFERINKVLEIGGGYGRNAYVILALNPNIRVTLVDIPPALYIAQRYLSSVFKDRRVFKARNFTRYEEVKEEMEAASIVFLMPHQLELMPEKHFDLCMNVSSFGEMSSEQIKWYFKQLGRVAGQHFYMKQWRVSNNVFDGVSLHESDYPYPNNWRRLHSRPCSVQTDFFEALYQVDNRDIQ